MTRRALRIRGDLLRWAREQQGLTMREVARRGGPSPGYQSDVETGRKTEVSGAILAPWIAALNVTQAFALGEIPCYHTDPAGARGLAAGVMETVRLKAAGAWAVMQPLDRLILVLATVSAASPRLPRVVLAYCLGISVLALDSMIMGQLVPTQQQMNAICDLAGLTDAHLDPSLNLEPGEPEWFKDFFPVLQLAAREGLTAEDLVLLIRKAREASAVRSQRTAEEDPSGRA